MQIVSFLDCVPSKLSFLDFGMGWGKWATMAKAFGVNSFGMEISQDRIDYAARTGVESVSWESVPSRSFDLINAEQVFEHIAEPVETLRHLSQGLKPRGLIKISVPTAYDIERRLRIGDWRIDKNHRNSLNPVTPLEHINCYSRKSLNRLASSAGLEEVNLPMRHQYKYMCDWTSATRAAKNLLLPLYRNCLKGQSYVFFRKVAHE